jgi:DNA-binding NarL/FixJ family response regulator
MGIFSFRKNTDSPKRAITIYIVEDNVLYAKQLEFFLQNKFGRNVSIQTFPVSEVIEVKLEHGHIPDIIIMDHHLSERYEDAASGMESLNAIREQHPQIRLILHSALGVPDLAGGDIAQGLFTYIPKGGDAFSKLEAEISPLIEKAEPR